MNEQLLNRIVEFMREQWIVPIDSHFPDIDTNELGKELGADNPIVVYIIIKRNSRTNDKIEFVIRQFKVLLLLTLNIQEEWLKIKYKIKGI